MHDTLQQGIKLTTGSAARLGVTLLGLLVALAITWAGWETPPVQAEAPEGTTIVVGIIKTNKGDIRIALYPDMAPITVANFLKLVKSAFYKGLTFHRYVPNFVIQGGDPKGDGTGGPGWTIKDEHDNGLTHIEGALAMARSNRPNSAGSQFYLTLAPAHQLDNQYTVFGRVTQGMDVVKKLRAGDVMNEITIVSEGKKPKEEKGEK